jgi:uncharacterized membrane protein YbhN (UPF0104 family)
MRHDTLLTHARNLLTHARSHLERIPRRLLRAVLAVATVAFVLLTARGMSSSMPSLEQIRHPDVLWIGASIVLEFAALIAYALIVRSVLAVWGVHGRTGALLRATLGGIAMGASLPAGQAVSLTYWYRQLRRAGAEPRLAAFALAAAGVAGLMRSRRCTHTSPSRASCSPTRSRRSCAPCRCSRAAAGPWRSA